MEDLSVFKPWREAFSTSTQGWPMPARTSSGTPLSASLSSCLDDKLNIIREQITRRADELANPANDLQPAEQKQIDIQNLSKAIDEIVKGESAAPDQRPTLFDYFPPFTFVCALLCLAFAVLGLVPLSTDPSGASKAAAASAGFLDIAKIFAGAIVGSTTSVALSSGRAKRLKDRSG